MSIRFESSPIQNISESFAHLANIQARTHIEKTAGRARSLLRAADRIEFKTFVQTGLRRLAIEEGEVEVIAAMSCAVAVGRRARRRD